MTFRSRVPYLLGDVLMADASDSPQGRFMPTSSGTSGSPVGTLDDPSLEDETGRTSPYQVKSPFEHTILQVFEKLLPPKPYCSDDPAAFGLCIRSRSHAVRRNYIQLNAPTHYSFLPFDVDRALAAFAWEDVNLPAPNIIIANPKNGHAHIIYMLADPVHALVQPRSRPSRYLADIERGMIRRLEADPGYSGLIAKNPLVPRWRTRWLAPLPYHLAQLDASLTRADKRRILRWEHEVGLGRNCTLFDELRHIAYREVLDFKRRSKTLAQFKTRIEDIAAGLNLQFSTSAAGPLGPAEMRGIARSVSRFCWCEFSPGRFAEVQRFRTQARTRRHLAIVEAIKNGRA